MIMLKKLLLILLLTVALLVAASVFFHHALIRFADTPTNPLEVTHDFSVTPGMTLTGVAQLLADKGLIDSSFQFRLLARSQNQSSRIQAGEYQLHTNMTPRKILEMLTQGKVKLNRLTLPEGLSLKQIAAVVETSGLGNSEAFKKAATDPGLLKQYTIPGATAEGYLYPETYFFSQKTSAEAMVKAMLHRFETVFTDKMEKRAQELGFSRHEVVTLASIVEKETGDAKEYPIIGSVFHNRLKKGNAAGE